jgi:methylmalonyl-CoA/ethylmalonyl-CoA epimerase
VSSIQEDLKQLPGMKFVDHVAIAVKMGELDGQVKAYEMLGFKEIHREEVHGTDQVREALLQIGDGPNLIQLLEPLTGESPVQKLIDRNGGRGGLAHVAFRVESAQHAFEAMQSSGFQLIDKAPRKGSRGTTVFFVHPKSRADNPFGFLIEIVEDPEGK